ncbi:MAG: recombinase family protein [Clostridiales bacterium]|nr:recombinase family protein [Clostridiales bacterium]
MTKPQTALLRVALYIRVSSDEQAERGDSIRDQKERGIKYIDDHQNMVLQDTYIDDGVSGQKLDRDDFTRLIGNVKAGLVDLIIFTKLDRWFRSLRHYLNIQVILDKYNVAWTAIDQPYFDTSTPYGRAFVAQSMTWAELEAQNGGLRVADVFRSKVEHGEVITGKVPKGYKIENKHLVFSEEAPAILDSIQYFHREQGLAKTVEYMQKTHGINMSIQNLKNSILRNEKYTGRYRGNDAYCPRLISDDMYQDIQRVLDRNSTIRSNQKYPYIFSGILVCDECGHKLCGCHINVVSHRASGKVYRYKYPAYECLQYRAYKKCSNGGEIREMKIEEYLLGNLREELSGYLVDFETGEARRIDNRAKKNKIRKKLDRLKDLYLNEIISLDEYKEDRTEYEKQLEELPDTELPGTDLESIRKILDCNFENMYAGLSNEEKRAFWRSIIKEIRISKSVERNRKYQIIFL